MGQSAAAAFAAIAKAVNTVHINRCMSVSSEREIQELGMPAAILPQMAEE
jgi:hypothetical protein